MSVIEEAAPILEMRNMTKHFAGVTALDDVSLALRKGEVLILVGENGAGKSTLMKILAGVHSPDGGEIILNGRKIPILTPHHAIQLGISIIYQEMALFPDLTAAENIFIGREMLATRAKWTGLLKRRQMLDQARQLLHDLDKDISPSTRVRDLRVGQRQVVEIARALNSSAQILILDEPTSALEDAERLRLFDHIQTLKQQGVAILYVSHRLQECMEIGDRIMVLRDGRKVADRPVAETTVDQVVDLMVGHSLKDFFPKQTVSIGDPLLQVKNLSRANKYQDISFELRRGEILGIAGLPDSGKNELASALFGTEPYHSGEIVMLGRPISLSNPSDATRHGIAYVPADRKIDGLFLEHSVRMNITIANLRSVMQILLSNRRERRLAGQYVKELRIKTPSVEQITRNLSGGNQQKVMLARWLNTKPQVLILAEPTRGIDVGAKIEVFELVTTFVRSGGAVIMVSSELPELAGMCDRTIVMYEGSVVAELDRAETSEQRLAWYQVHRTEEAQNGVR